MTQLLIPKREFFKSLYVSSPIKAKLQLDFIVMFPLFMNMYVLICTDLPDIA